MASVQIPPTVKGILASRIDRLSPAEKDLLQTLAVVGRSFPLDMIRRVTRCSDEELAPQLENLQLGEFIYEIPAFPESEYVFKHALTQEVAYDSVLIERRRPIHERTAAAIEDIYRSQLDDHLSELAHHYSRGGNGAKAVQYLTLAARQARVRSAYGDALGYINEAIAIVTAMPQSRQRDHDEIELQTARVPLLIAVHGFMGDELAQCLGRAFDLSQRLGEGPEMFGVMFALWSFNLGRNRLNEAANLVEKILNLASLANNELASAGAYSAYGETCLWRGEFVAAREKLDQAIEVYDRDLERYLPLPNAAVVRSRCNLSWTLWMLGYPDQAETRSEEALRFATKIGYPFSMVYSLMYSIALSDLQSDYHGIRPRAESLIEIARENGFPFWSAVASMVIGAVLVGEGRHDVGIIRMREALSTMRETGGDLIRLYGLGLLVESYLIARQPEHGLATVTEVLKGIQESGQRILEPEIWRLRGDLIMLHGGADQEVERSFRRAIEIAQAQQARSWELRAATSLGRYLRQHDRPDEARSILQPIHAGLTEGFDRPDYRDATEVLRSLG